MTQGKLFLDIVTSLPASYNKPRSSPLSFLLIATTVINSIKLKREWSTSTVWSMMSYLISRSLKLGPVI